MEDPRIYRELKRIADALETIASAFTIASTPTVPSQPEGVTVADD